MRDKIPAFLLSKTFLQEDLHERRGSSTPSFIDKGMKHLSHMIVTGYMNAGQESQRGLFQRLDPRVKILFLAFFIVIVSLKKEILPEMVMTLFTFMLVALSRINLWYFYRKVIALTFFFGFLVVCPAAFNVVTPGEVVVPVYTLSRPHEIWIYHVPQQIGLTRQGIDGVLMLSLRVMNSVTLSLLVLYTTSFDRIIKALQVFRVPETFLLIITLSYKYIFVFAKTLESMYLAKKSRLIGMVENDAARMWIAGRMAHVFRKTMSRYEELFKAMVARGFTEEVKLSGFGALTTADRISSYAFLLVGIILLWL